MGFQSEFYSQILQWLNHFFHLPWEEVAALVVDNNRDDIDEDLAGSSHHSSVLVAGRSPLHLMALVVKENRQHLP